MPIPFIDYIPQQDVFKNFTKPLYKGVQRNVNGVRRVLSIPCAQPVEVYVETLLPALASAFYTLISPDPKEVYHKVTGKSFVCDVGTVGHDVAEFTGKSESPTTRFLFKALPLYDIATWWFFIADIGSDALSNWTTGIYNERECNLKNDPHFGSGGLWGGAIHSAGGWSQIDFFFTAPSHFAPVSPPSVTLAPGRRGYVAASAEFSLFGGPPVGTESRVIDYGTGNVLDYHNNADVNSDKPNGPNRVWYRPAQASEEVFVMHVEWQCQFGPAPGGNQVFPIDGQCHCTMHD